MPSPTASRANGSASAGRARPWAAQINALRGKLAAWLAVSGRAARLSDAELAAIVEAAHMLGALARWELDRRKAERDAAESAAKARQILSES